jgi:hypothetical protein
MNEFSIQPGVFKLKTLTCFAALVLLLAVVPASADQKFQRIRFARGRTTAVVKGVVTNSVQENVHQYKLRASQGQTLIVHLASPEKAANFGLGFANDASADDGHGNYELKDWEGTIPASGDLVITIYHRGRKAGMPYTLEVTVR